MNRSVFILIGALMLVPASLAPRAQQVWASGSSGSSSETGPGLAVLAPTAHPQVPRELSQLWLAPERGSNVARSTALASMGSAAKLAADGEYGKALGLVSQPAAKDGPLGQYAAYYAGLAQLSLKRPADALKSFRDLQEQKPVGYLWEGAALGEADAHEARDHPADAVRIYDRLLKGRLANVEDVYMRLGRAAKAAGDNQKAADAFTHVFYEFPLGEYAAIAGAELNALMGQRDLTAGSQRYAAELGRAERLFSARQYGDARTSFEGLRQAASGDDRELLQLRIAECDYFTKRTLKAREALGPLGQRASRQAEAVFYFALASRDAGEVQTFLQLLERVETEFANQTWAEDALDNLASYYLKRGDDDRADEYFRQLYERYPRGKYSERAAWKIGWTSYRAGNFPDTIRVFERASSDFARSDYRPAWLYWAGRAHEQRGEGAVAQARFTLEAVDYANSYYGRLALKRLDATTAARLAAGRPPGEAPVQAGSPLPPNGPMIRALLAAEMYEDALNELRYAEHVWGDSSAIEATVAWTRQQQARTETGWHRFQLLRGAITTMRRAYPQFLAAGGEALPREVLSVIFPIAYWDLIREHSRENGLDPYFVAALVAQESTFVADVKSAANAYGLMQLLPSTARMYARKLNLPYSPRLLTEPDANIRMGTAYLADKLREFGDLHLALASYNAGERAVHRWQGERPDLATDEFIDDIPYPETQNYVKRILGTADDYRHLYGAAPTVEGVETNRKPVVVPPSPASTRKPAPPRPAPAKKAPPRTATPHKR